MGSHSQTPRYIQGCYLSCVGILVLCSCGVDTQLKLEVLQAHSLHLPFSLLMVFPVQLAPSWTLALRVGRESQDLSIDMNLPQVSERQNTLISGKKNTCFFIIREPGCWPKQYRIVQKIAILFFKKRKISLIVLSQAINARHRMSVSVILVLHRLLHTVSVCLSFRCSKVKMQILGSKNLGTEGSLGFPHQTLALTNKKQSCRVDRSPLYPDSLTGSQGIMLYVSSVVSFGSWRRFLGLI